MLQGELEREEDSPYKRKCRSWGFESLEEESRSCKEAEGDRTLELFPLHPEGRWRGLKKLLFFFSSSIVSCFEDVLFLFFFSFFFPLSFSSFFVLGKKKDKVVSLYATAYYYSWLVTKALSSHHSLFDDRYLCACLVGVTVSLSFDYSNLLNSSF